MSSCGILVAILIVLILLLVFKPTIACAVRGWMGLPSAAPTSTAPASSAPVMPDTGATNKVVVTGAAAKEHMTTAPDPSIQLPAQTSDMLLAMGHTGTIPWDEVIQATELDPSTFSSQQEFVKDVRRFSSGANFTSVTDDNTNLAFTNFVGLQRPQHVPIGSTARQIPDIDENVLQRNHQLRFN